MRICILFLLVFILMTAVVAEPAARSNKPIDFEDTRNVNFEITESETVKVAHIIGENSETTEFFYGVSTGYYNSAIQAEMAKDNLSHITCKQNGSWNNNNASAFFVDVEDYARNNNITGDFRTCRNKALITVAHYIRDSDTGANARCKVRRSFETKLAGSEFGFVDNIASGRFTGKNYDQDFAFLKIDFLRYSEKPNFRTLKICTDPVVLESISGQKCTKDYKDGVILPQLSGHLDDSFAKFKGLKYKAKVTSNQCCISENDPHDNTFIHTCDLNKSASGSPLLNIKGEGEPCVLGIQNSQSVQNKKVKQNYAISVSDYAFKQHFKKFIEQTCKAP